MKLVYVCSPYRGDIEGNTVKAQGYCRFVYSKRSVPIAPHLHNTQFLDESIPEERRAGMLLGLHFLKKCDELWCFGERHSQGMRAEIFEAKELSIPIRYFTDTCQEVLKHGQN